MEVNQNGNHCLRYRGSYHSLRRRGRRSRMIFSLLYRRQPMKQYFPQQPLRSTAPHTDRKTRRHQAMVDRGPLLQDSLSTTVPPSSSDRPKDPPKKESRRSNSHVAVPRDHLQSEAAPDISALDLEHSWSSEFRLRQLRLEHDCELVRNVATSLRHERFIVFYTDDPIAHLNAQ